MKKTFKILVLLLSVASLTACSKDDDNKNPSGKDTFFAKIDGLDYKPPFVTGFVSDFTQTLLITGATGSNAETIQFLVPVDISVGTYSQLNDPLADILIQAYYSPPNSSDAFDDGLANVGSLVITKNDIANRIIEGTFSFTTKAAVNSGISWTITEGRFSVTYQDL
jgi:hypothetical protein